MQNAIDYYKRQFNLGSLSKEERKRQNIKEIRKNVGLVFQFPEVSLVHCFTTGYK